MAEACWSLVEADSSHGAHSVVLAAPVGEVVVIPPLQDVMRTPVVWLLVHHPPSKHTDAVCTHLPLQDTNLAFMHLIPLDCKTTFDYLRSSKHADRSHPVEAVAAHQVGDVILEFHLLPRESSSLKQLGSGGVVVLFNNTYVRKKCWLSWAIVKRHRITVQTCFDFICLFFLHCVHLQL